MYIYRVVNVKSGETFEDNAKNIAERLGIHLYTVSKASETGSLIYREWSVERLYNDLRIPKALLEEWDKTTGEIRELLQKYPRTEGVRIKRKSYFRKPQEI